MIKSIGFVLLLLVAFGVSAQNVFQLKEDSLLILQNKLYAVRTEPEKAATNALFVAALQKVLSDPLSLSYPFDSLKEISRIVAPDQTFRIITWDLPHTDGTFSYYGFIQWTNPKKHLFKLFTLVDKSGEIKNPENSILDPSKWIGAVYYKLIPFKSQSNHLYALLGYNGHDKITTKKLIEVLSISSDGGVKFGADVFKWDKHNLKRMIFEYASQAVMSLKFEQENKRIVFDHLSAPESKLEGQYQYYGPDWSIDCVALKKGKWVYMADIDARNQPNAKDNSYADPKSKKKDYKAKQLYNPTVQPHPDH